MCDVITTTSKCGKSRGDLFFICPQMDFSSLLFFQLRKFVFKQQLPCRRPLSSGPHMTETLRSPTESVQMFMIKEMFC